MNPAAKCREEKEAHPERFCQVRACLWRVLHRDGRVTPCRKHPQYNVTGIGHPPESCQDCGMPFNDAEPGPNGRCVRCNA